MNKRKGKITVKESDKVKREPTKSVGPTITATTINNAEFTGGEAVRVK